MRRPIHPLEGNDPKSFVHRKTNPTPLSDITNVYVTKLNDYFRNTIFSHECFFKININFIYRTAVNRTNMFGGYPYYKQINRNGCTLHLYDTQLNEYCVYYKRNTIAIPLSIVLGYVHIHILKDTTTFLYNTELNGYLFSCHMSCFVCSNISSQFSQSKTNTFFSSTEISVCSDI